MLLHHRFECSQHEAGCRVPPAAAAGNYKIMKSIKIMNLSPAQGYLWDLQTGLQSKTDVPKNLAVTQFKIQYKPLVYLLESFIKFQIVGHHLTVRSIQLHIHQLRIWRSHKYPWLARASPQQPSPGPMLLIKSRPQRQSEYFFRIFSD